MAVGKHSSEVHLSCKVSLLFPLRTVDVLEHPLRPGDIGHQAYQSLQEDDCESSSNHVDVSLHINAYPLQRHSLMRSQWLYDILVFIYLSLILVASLWTSDNTTS